MSILFGIESRDVKIVTVRWDKLHFGQGRKSNILLFHQEEGPGTLRDFIAEKNLNYGSFFLDVKDEIPDCSFISGSKFLKKKPFGFFFLNNSLSGTFSFKRRL